MVLHSFGREERIEGLRVGTEDRKKIYKGRCRRGVRAIRRKERGSVE